jgi:DUF1009 family protein
MTERLGLIAGNGALPESLALEAKKLGLEVFAVGHQGETLPSLASIVSAYTSVQVGQLGRIIKFFKQHKVTQAVMLGGITKATRLLSLRPDWRGVKLLASLKFRGDDALLRAIADEFQKEGITIVSAAEYLKSCLAPAGLISARPLSETEKTDARLGWSVAKQIGQLEIGQTVVTCKGVVIAVEAIEGTDAAIRRAGELTSQNFNQAKTQTWSASNSGLVVVKTSKPGQDMRLDIPTVGITTLNILKQAGVSALVLEAGHCFIQDPITFKQMADNMGIAVEGWS